MADDTFWFVNMVSVQTYIGQTDSGPKYADSAAVACWVEDETVLVRSPDGSEVVSSARVFAPLDQAVKFPPGSKVTTSTRTAFVIKTNAFDSGSLEMGIDHIQVDLT